MKLNACSSTECCPHPTDPRLHLCNLQNSLQHSTQQIGCSLSQCPPLCPHSPMYHPPLRPACSRQLAPSTYSSSDPPAPGHLSLLGKALPYFSSLVTITTTRNTQSSRYISLVIPKANTTFGRLSFQFSAANDWNDLQKSLKLDLHLPH